MFLGLRVIRGPDWSSGESDGGEGHLGTVVAVDKAGGTVDVIWDNGHRRTCQAGSRKELRVFDSAPAGCRHTTFTCEACGEQGIFGMRWACRKCPEVQLCPLCYVTDKHSLNHEFARFDYPGADGVIVKTRNTSQRVQSMGIFPGARVVRGDDWKWGDQDGGQGGKGTVVSIGKLDDSATTSRSVANVKWDKGQQNTMSTYRVGHLGKMELKCVEEAPGTYTFKHHLPVLDVTVTMKSSVDLGILLEDDIVCIGLDEEELKRVQTAADGWTASMAQLIGKFGTVKCFTPKGNVVVAFDPHRFRFHPGALVKVPDISVGDVVEVMRDEKKCRLLQDKHGGWNTDMATFLGKVGRVVKKDDTGNVVVAFGQTAIILNPACCTPAPGQPLFSPPGVAQIQPLSGDSMGLHEALLQLLGAMLAADLGEDHGVNIDDLYKAIAEGDVAGCRSIVSKKSSLIKESHRGVTPLILASHEGQLEMVKVMLDNGADIQATDHKGNTPLHAALIGKRERVSKLLIDRGANVKVLNKGRQSCAHLAAWANQSTILPELMKKGCDINTQDENNDTPLHDAIHKDSAECIRILLTDSKVNLNIPNNKGMMALHYAALRNNVVAIDLILGKNKSLSTVFRSGNDYTALHIAAANDHVEVARLLIDKGACPVDIVGFNGRTPLQVATIEAYFKMSELLASKNAQLDLHDNDGNTALHLLLGAKRADTGEEMTVGEIRSRVRVACFLMENNATYNLKNKQGFTPVELAKNQKLRSAIEVYVEKHKQDLRSRPVTPFGKGRCPTGMTSLKTLRDFNFPCSFCYSRMSDVTFRPCGHKILCQSCCVSVQICPMCETFVERKMLAVNSGDEQEQWYWK